MDGFERIGFARSKITERERPGEYAVFILHGTVLSFALARTYFKPGVTQKSLDIIQALALSAVQPVQTRPGPKLKTIA